MTAPTPLECTELLTVKLCHDLAGPVGAVNNGVELLKDEDTTFHKDSLDLVEASAKEAVDKLMYFRQAFGTSNLDSEVTLETIQQLALNYFSKTKSQLIWAESPSSTISSTLAKIILNLLLIASSSLITGGTISISIGKNLGRDKIIVLAEGNMIKVTDEVLTVLQHSQSSPRITIKNIQPYVMMMLVNASQLKLDLSYQAHKLELKLT